MASIGSTEITRGDLASYLQTSLIEEGNLDFYRAPYRQCVARKKELGQTESDAELVRECKLEKSIRRAQALRFLIRAEWLEREASRRGIPGRERAVRARLKAQRRLFPSAAAYRAAVAKSGIKLSDIRLRTRAEILYEDLLKATHLPAGAASRYYKRHPEEVGSVDHRDVYVLVADTRGAGVKARQFVHATNDWPDAIARYARVGQRKERRPLTLIEGQVGPVEFGVAAFNAPRGRVIGPIKSKGGWYVGEVVTIRRGVKRSFAQSRKSITRDLATDKLERALQSRYGPITDCQSSYEMEGILTC